MLSATTFGFWIGAVIVLAGARKLLPFRLRVDLSLLISMLRDALPLAIVLALGVVHYRIDVLILSAMRGMGDVGYYGVGTKLLDVALAGAAIFTGLVLPVLSRRAAGDEILLQRAFQKAVDFMLIVGIAIAVFASALAPVLVQALAGSGFQGAVMPLSIIAWAVPVMYANAVFSQMVVAANRQSLAVPITLAAIALNVVLNVALIPRLGATAPALVTVITESATALGMLIVTVRLYRFAPSPSAAARIFVAGVVAALLLLSLRAAGPLIAGFLAAAGYLLSLLALRVVGVNDARAILGLESV
jgi:O-antigen/teichoic acid export membrane protein